MALNLSRFGIIPDDLASIDNIGILGVDQLFIISKSTFRRRRLFWMKLYQAYQFMKSFWYIIINVLIDFFSVLISPRGLPSCTPERNEFATSRPFSGPVQLDISLSDANLL